MRVGSDAPLPHSRGAASRAGHVVEPRGGPNQSHAMTTTPTTAPQQVPQSGLLSTARSAWLREACQTWASMFGLFLAGKSGQSLRQPVMGTESTPSIPTRQSLLVRLKDWDDSTSWKDFFDTYWKLIYGVARKAGLTDAEAQDVV